MAAGGLEGTVQVLDAEVGVVEAVVVGGGADHALLLVSVSFLL